MSLFQTTQKTALSEEHRHLPQNLQLALESAHPAARFLARFERVSEGRFVNQVHLEPAVSQDLDSIIRLVSTYPDNDERAQNRGFLRGRFTAKEYLQLIDDGCIRVVRENEKVKGFISVLPWSHELIGPERFVTKVRFGPIGCHWTGDDYSAVVKKGSITYIAEAAVATDASGAAAHLIRALPQLRAESPDNYLVTTCSEAPIANLHAATLVQRLGFERIGYVWLPFRPMSVGPYPGKIKLVAPFQSGIWCMKPLNSTG